MADRHWESVTDDLLDGLPPAALAAVRQVAEELTARESMIFLDGRKFTPEKPFRFTLDLDRAHHQFLKDYALRAETGASKVMRALLDELRDDPELAGRVRDRIWRAPDRRPLVPQNAEERYPRG